MISFSKISRLSRMMGDVPGTGRIVSEVRLAEKGCGWRSRINQALTPREKHVSVTGLKELNLRTSNEDLTRGKECIAKEEKRVLSSK